MPPPRNPPNGHGPEPPLTPPPTVERKPRKPVDAELITYLADYATRLECPVRFKLFLQNVILQGGTEEEQIALANHYLRNPEVKQYGFTDDFTFVISQYDIFDTWIIPSSDRTTVPYGDIPDQYRPAGLAGDSGIWVPSPKSSKASPHTPRKAAPQLTEEDMETDVASKTNELKRWRVDPVPGREGELEDGPSPKRRRSSSPSGAAREDGSAGIDMQTLLETFRRLRSIPSGSRASDAPGRAQTERAGISDMSDRTGPDWTEDSFYRGTLQPPLAVRLQNAITFLADEDVDRDPRWKTRFAELCDYLPWLANDDEDYQLGKASRRTRAMFDEAVDMAKAHILFEKHHYEPTYVESPPFVVQPTGLGGGPFNPIKSTRLNWTGVVHDWPTPSPAAPPRRNDQPTRLYPRQPIFINPIADADKKIRERFVRHAKRYWEQDDESESNLAHIEGEAFFRYVALGPVETLKYDTVTGQTRLPDGRLVVPGSAIDWAREQGARRAGLQNLLRDFENKEHRSLPDARCRRVVLPTPASKVLAVRQKTAKPQWTPVALKKSELPPLADLETHLYTVFYRKFTRHLRRLREAARLEAEEAYGQNDGWVTLPRNIASGGPFVLRSIDARTQANQDLLAKCIKTVKVLETESMRASRPLLDKMLDVIQSGIDGRFAAGIPGDIKLAADEWEHVGNATRVRYVDDDDIQWLRFLATESVNDGTWQGRFDPDQPKEKYKLFLIFARRVQKLLDDRDPESLFNTHDAVTVEQLLTAINAGYATSAVEKCKFHPYDACAWLNRLRISGHIRFRYNQANYGLIQRPILQYHPEHRIAPPTPPSRPSYPLSIRPWSAVVGPSPPLPRPSPSSPTDPIHNFLLALALRLGHTIHSLRAPPLTPATPLPTTAFLAAVNAYRALSRAQTARARLPSLGALVRRLDLTGRDFPLPAPSTNPGAPAPAPLLPEREALARIRARVIDEVARNENMLHPARERLFVSEWDDEEEPRRLLRRDVSWDFAAAVVRGGRPRFFAVDRWPVVVPVPTVDGAVVVVDASQTADPAVEDPTERRWKREKLRRYGDTGPVRVKEGPAVFPVGDTRAQMRAVERRMTDLVYATAGLARERPETGWFGRVWQRLNPFARGGGVGMPMDDDDPRRVRADEPYLPEVDLDTVPRSRPSRARVVEVEDNWDEDDI